jgi:hypothetical protein
LPEQDITNTRPLFGRLVIVIGNVYVIAAKEDVVLRPPTPIIEASAATRATMGPSPTAEVTILIPCDVGSIALSSSHK